MFEIDSARLPDLMPISGKLRGVAFPPSSPRRYDSHLTDEEWRLIKSLFPPPATTGRRQKHARREIVDAILCVVQPGRAWRFLPREFPPWQTVFWYFGRRRADGSLDILRKRGVSAPSRCCPPLGGGAHAVVDQPVPTAGALRADDGRTCLRSDRGLAPAPGPREWESMSTSHQADHRPLHHGPRVRAAARSRGA